MSESELVYKLDLNNEELNKIIKEYGSVTEFCRRYALYLQGEKGIKMKIPERIKANLTNFFDLSNAYSMGENSGYAQLAADILKIRPGFFVYGSIEEIINSAMDEVLSIQDKDVVRAFYNLDGRNRDVSELEDIYDMTAKELMFRKQRCVRRISAGRKSGQLQRLSRLIVNSAIAEEVLPEIITTGDAIAEVDYIDCDNRKIELVYNILQKEIDYITYTGDLDYIYQGLDVKTKISSSVLSEENKKILLDSVDYKIKQIAEDNKDSIIATFMERIKFFMHDEHELRRYKSLEKDINNSGLDKESINLLMNKLPEIKIKPKTTYEIIKKDLMLRLQFPQTELTVDQMHLKGRCPEALKKANLLNVGQLISYSRKELLKFVGLNGIYVSEIFEELERIGYDIPEDESVPIDTYNHDKLHGDNYHEIVEDIQSLQIDSETKSELIGMVLESKIVRLKREYADLSRLIRTYTDIFMTHEDAKLETADEGRYRRKIQEAEAKREKIKKKIELLSR